MESRYYGNNFALFLQFLHCKIMEKEKLYYPEKMCANGKNLCSIYKCKCALAFLGRRVSGQMVRVIKRPTSIEERRRKCVENGGRRRKRDKSLTMTTSRSWHSSDAVFRYLCRCQPDIHADIQRRTREARSIREKLIFIVFEEWLENCPKKSHNI